MRRLFKPPGKKGFEKEKMKILSAEFIKSAPKKEHWPGDRVPEIALVGRSNVGKSSLINTFVNRRGLAKTSSQPGKTQMINFYTINGEFRLVDLPGFGYAKVPLSMKKSWKQMMEEYLSERESLAGVILILDARRDVGDAEQMLFEWIEEFGLPVVTVFTKTDKLSKNQLASRIARLKRVLPLKDPVIFSAVTGEGKIALGKRIHKLLTGASAEAGA